MVKKQQASPVIDFWLASLTKGIFQAWPGFLNKTCVINSVHTSTVHVSLFMSVNSDNEQDNESIEK
jgi:hypothetical protein